MTPAAFGIIDKAPSREGTLGRHGHGAGPAWAWRWAGMGMALGRHGHGAGPAWAWRWAGIDKAPSREGTRTHRSGHAQRTGTGVHARNALARSGRARPLACVHARARSRMLSARTPQAWARMDSLTCSLVRRHARAHARHQGVAEPRERHQVWAERKVTHAMRTQARVSAHARAHTRARGVLGTWRMSTRSSR
jgi:hypothetical protein